MALRAADVAGRRWYCFDTANFIMLHDAKMHVLRSPHGCS